MPGEKQIIFVDIDGTICKTPGTEYVRATPIQWRIDKINKLYDDGNRIVYYTARGALTGKDWRELTEWQLDKWGCKRHELRLDKPLYDIMYDDRAENARELFSIK